MSPAQSAIFSILNERASLYRSFKELEEDAFFSVWFKHAHNKEFIRSYIEGKFKQRSLEEESRLKNIPKYF